MFPTLDHRIGICGFVSSAGFLIGPRMTNILPLQDTVLAATVWSLFCGFAGVAIRQFVEGPTGKSLRRWSCELPVESKWHNITCLVYFFETAVSKSTREKFESIVNHMATGEIAKNTPIEVRGIFTNAYLDMVDPNHLEDGQNISLDYLDKTMRPAILSELKKLQAHISLVYDDTTKTIKPAYYSWSLVVLGVFGLAFSAYQRR